MNPQMINSQNLSQLMYIPTQIEPDSKLTSELCESGIFVGNSYIYSMPIMVNFDKLINPHILTIGMTGSGKSFLMKNLILRLSILEESKIILIDFTGEYQKQLTLQLTIPKDTNPENYGENEITYFNLSSRSETERISMSSEILRNSLLLMRKQEINTKKRIFIVLDEAWKLLKSEKSLETIIREGRKYGVGLILSSQLIDDADNATLSNIATLFLFRTQNKKSLDKIAQNYNISEHYIEKIQNLDLGSCMIIQLYKSNQRSSFIIRKVIGLNFNQILKIKLGNGMGIDITSDKLEKLVNLLCVDTKNNIMKSTIEKGEISLNELITELLKCNVDRREILREFKKLGFDDFSLSDSFSYAICEAGKKHEH